MNTTDTQLGALLDRYQRMRVTNPHARIEALRDAAGDLYAELADLAACLDVVQEGGGPPPGPNGPARAARRGWIWLALALFAAAGLLGAWSLDRPGPARLRILVHPKASVRVGGEALGKEPLGPGRYGVEVKRKGFAPQAFTIELTGEDLTRTVHLVPLDPFGRKPLRVLARSYGVNLGKARARLPRPVGICTRVDEARALVMRHPEAFEMELQRYPEAVRERDDIHYMAMRKLFRAALFAESYHAACDLAKRHPDRPEPWYHAARALWGLGLVESKLYAEVLAKMDAAVK